LDCGRVDSVSIVAFEETMNKKVFSNRKSYKPEVNGRDNCQSPPYAILPLLPYLPKDAIIWEPARGEGYLEQSLRLHGYNVVSSSLQAGQDFFQYEPPEWDIAITNPPWSRIEKWMKRLFLLNKPWGLLIPTDKQQNIGIQKLFQKYGDVEHLHPDARIDFKMPINGWKDSNAQINVNWFTFGLNIGKSHTYLCPIKKEKAAFKKELERMAEIEAGQLEL